MVSLSIDGKQVQVAVGTTILEAAQKVGIRIPTLCWLGKVSPTGACRVCVVDVEGVDRPMTACNTPVKEGIRVTTTSESLIEIRRKMVKLLLVNHPLDCPVCDAAGECDLQDICHELGIDKQAYGAVNERRRIRFDWPLLESDPNRCILCEKCVKVDHEIVGADAICVTSRGEATIIDTPDGKPLSCEFCGNCIAACPTGTLISKPFKFRARPWALSVSKGICAFCSTGCQIEYHHKDGRVERVTSSDDTYNKGNLCINGRFGYSYLNSSARLTHPLLRDASSQREVSWDQAVERAADGLKRVISNHGAAAVAAIGSPRMTTEESYLFQKLVRQAIGSSNIDTELRLGYARSQGVLRSRLGLSGASAPIERIDGAKAIMVIGSDLNAESTGVEYRVLQAVTKGDAQLIVATNRGVKLNRFANSSLCYRAGSEAMFVNGFMKAMIDEGADHASASRIDKIAELKSALARLSYGDIEGSTGLSEQSLRAAAKLLVGRGSVAVLFGADVMRGAAAEAATDAVVNLALLSGAVSGEQGGLFPIEEKNNSQGALDAGVAFDLMPGYLPAPAGGKDLKGIVDGIEQGSIRALIVAGADPVATLPGGDRLRQAFAKLEHLVVVDAFPTETTRLAHVLLPAALPAEKSGSFTTPDQRRQWFDRAVSPKGEAKSDGEIFTLLSNRLTGASALFDPSQTAAELAQVAPALGSDRYKVGSASFSALQSAPASASAHRLLCGPILFHNGTMSTWSENNLSVAQAGYLELSSADAAKLGITEGEGVRLTTTSGTITGTARISNRMPAGLFFAPYHFRDLKAPLLLSWGSNLVDVQVSRG